MNIITDVNKLKVPSTNVEKPVNAFTRQIIREMCDFVDLNSHVVGLSAPQIGLNRNIIVVKDTDSSLYYFVNPRIMYSSKKKIVDNEMCLSLPNKVVAVKRSTSIKFSYYDYRTDETLWTDASDYFARVIQHEIDHLNGILITDYEKEANSPLVY